PGRAPICPARADVDDGAALLGHHRRQDRPAAEHCPSQVHGEHLVPVGHLRLGCESEVGSARRGDQDVDSAVLGQRALRQRAHCRLVAHVTSYRDGTSAILNDLPRNPVQLGTGARGQNNRRALPREGARHGSADAAACAGDDGNAADEPQMMSPPRDLISSMNSARVSAFSRNAPSIAEVTAFEFCFSTPRMSMHMCSASITTATPRGWSTSSMVWAIWVVRRSCTWSRRLNISTSRGIFDSPTIFRDGM